MDDQGDPRCADNEVRGNRERERLKAAEATVEMPEVVRQWLDKRARQQELAQVTWNPIHAYARQATRKLMTDSLTELQPRISELMLSFARVSHGNSVACGWYDDLTTGLPLQRNVGEMMALLHEEISEALDGFRKGRMDDHLPNRRAVEVELADALHRIFDLAGYLNLDLGGAYAEKGLYNLRREDHKLEERAKDGGLKF